MMSRVRFTGCFLIFLSLASLSWGASAVAPAERLAEAQGLLDEGQIDQALALLDQVLRSDKKNAEALLLRSTGRIMNGDVQGGVADLKKAIKEDPGLRQGWLNLAGLEIAQSRFEEAHAALLKAQELDPDSSDNALNLGAVVLMQGKVAEAAPYFARYLQLEGSSAEALYLVASNYALVGQLELAIDHLRRAVSKNEHMRLRARTDERFLNLDHPSYQRLLMTDSFIPAANAHKAAAAYGESYNSTDNRLLYAVLDALRQQQVRYDPGIEATADWALVWADFRIKVSNQADGTTGLVSLSAPAEKFTAEEWQRRSQDLFRAIHRSLNP